MSDQVTGDEKFKFKGPYSIPAIVKKGSLDVTADEKGTKVETTDGEALFARVSFEELNIPTVKIGDVIDWEGRYYDVLKVNTEGYIADTGTYVKLRCTLKILRAFSPERRLDEGQDVVAP